MFPTKHLIAAFALTISAFVGQAFACGCGGVTQAPPANSAELVRRVLDSAEYLFIGKVKGFEYRDDVVIEYMEQERLKNPLLKYETRFATITVERWWKGAPGPEVSLMTQHTRNSDGTSTNSSCDVSFKEGETYLVFARIIKGNLQTGACSGTSLVSNVKDIDLLGEGNPPIKFKN